MATMGGSGLIGFLQIWRGWKREGHPGLREQFWELARAASDYEGYRETLYADGRYFWPWLLSGDYRLL